MAKQMDSLSLCWRGMAGTGKKTRLHEALQAIAVSRGLPFTTQMKPLVTGSANPTGDVAEAGATEEGAGPGEAEAGQFLYESSLVHMGLDIARMSMQDKHILRPVLTKLGQGSHVLSGEKGRGSRILVLYHAHLLSSESVLLLQACLEQNEGDLSIWVTSELPVPQRIRDWFVEIPVGGTDMAFEKYVGAIGGEGPKDWPDIFKAILDKWRASPPPHLQEVKEIKAIVYEMLMRNLRWVEVAHFLLDAILLHKGITEDQRKRAIGALASCEATGGGYTIPSYRIPILWESLFLQLRTIVCSSPQSDGSSSGGSGRPTAPTSGPKRVSKSRKKSVAANGSSGSELD
jgi:hypothetical protein